MLVKTPCAQVLYLYQVVLRFHYAELYHRGVELFAITPQGDDDDKNWATTCLTKDPVDHIQQQLLDFYDTTNVLPHND